MKENRRRNSQSPFCLVMLLVFFSFCFSGSTDAAESDLYYLAKGADLSAEELGSIYLKLDISPEDMDRFQVVTISNEEEHEYLDTYLGPDMVGDRALSCAKIHRKETGYGITVTTDCIFYCTPGMYQNALLTAGVRDIDVEVAGPYEIAGTAALIGILKSYENMSGITVSRERIDSALKELVLTSEIADHMENSRKVEELFAAIKLKCVEAGTNNYGAISSCVDEVIQQLDMNLSNADKAEIISLMSRIVGMGMDPDQMQLQAEEIYTSMEQKGILY